MYKASNLVSKLPSSSARGLTSPRGQTVHPETQTRDVSSGYAKANISQHTGAFQNANAFASNLKLLTTPGVEPAPPDDADSFMLLGKEDTLIDAGCGLGVAARLAAKEGCKVIAYSPSAVEVNELKSHQAQHAQVHGGVDYREANALSDLKDVEPGSVTRIRLDRVLPYMNDSERNTFFRQASEALKPGGSVFCSFYHDSSKEEADHQFGQRLTLAQVVNNITQAGLKPCFHSVGVDASDKEGRALKKEVSPDSFASLLSIPLSNEEGEDTALKVVEKAITDIGTESAQGTANCTVRVNIVAYKPVT